MRHLVEVGNILLLMHSLLVITLLSTPVDDLLSKNCFWIEDPRINKNWRAGCSSRCVYLLYDIYRSWCEEWNISTGSKDVAHSTLKIRKKCIRFFFKTSILPRICIRYYTIYPFLEHSNSFLADNNCNFKVWRNTKDPIRLISEIICSKPIYSIELLPSTQ